MPRRYTPRKKTPPMVRFAAKVNPDGPVPDGRLDLGPCHLWLAHKNKRGYGKFCEGREPSLAHKWIYEQTRGPVPSGLELDHLCRNHGCVNVAHLEPVTHRVNSTRWAAEHFDQERCQNGHEWTPENTYYSTGKRPRRACRACTLDAQRRYQARRAAEARA